MYGTDSSITFDPICCYEELRLNILEEPFYISRGRDLLQNRGMHCWFDNINLFNEQLYTNKEDDDMNEPITSYRLKYDKGGFRNSLCMLLSDIILTIYPEVFCE